MKFQIKKKEKMKYIKSLIAICIICLTSLTVNAQTTQYLTNSAAGTWPPGSSVSCVGNYYGYIYVTNPVTSTVWFTAPTGTTLVTITDVSGIPAPYVDVIKVMRKDLVQNCGNPVSLALTPTRNQVKFIPYFKTLGTPTNGQPIILKIVWQ
jgi:hypothetical protein